MKKFIFLTFALGLFFSCNVSASALDDEDNRIPSFDTNPDGFFGFDPDDGKKLRSQSDDLTSKEEKKKQVVTGRIRSQSVAIPKKTIESMHLLFLKANDLKLSFQERQEHINSFQLT